MYSRIPASNGEFLVVSVHRHSAHRFKTFRNKTHLRPVEHRLPPMSNLKNVYYISGSDPKSPSRTMHMSWPPSHHQKHI